MKSMAELEQIKKQALEKLSLRTQEDKKKVVVGMATCGIAAGARPVLSALTDEVSRRGLKGIKIGQTGCIGVCRLEPLVEVYAPGQEKVTYVKVKPEMARRIVSEHLVNGQPVLEYTIGYHEQQEMQ